MTSALSRLLFCWLLLAALTLRAEDDDDDRAEAAVATAKLRGHVEAVVKDEAGQPAEFVVASLRRADGTVVQSTVTDARGGFRFVEVPAGTYTVSYNLVGHEAVTSESFAVDLRHARIDLGNLPLRGPVVKLESLEVRARQEKLLTAIDRKIYNVGRDIQSTAGSAGDLLQNVPSVDVDIDGKVSLRGSENVLILIDGRTSALMGRSRAEVLQQLPASEIERIEVITNPSAKYKPDGTAGIINLALKKKHSGGISGTVNASVGNHDRANGGASLNYRTDAWNLSGSVSVRQDDRPRFASDVRTITDPATRAVLHAEKRTTEHSRPLTRIARLGLDYVPTAADQFGVAASYNRRTFRRSATDRNLVTDAAGVVTSDYDRLRYDPEYEQDLEFSGRYRHTFAEEHELSLEWRAARSSEQEDNRYTNLSRTPALPPTRDNMRIKNTVNSDELLAQYTRPLADHARLESGYDFTDDRYAADFHAEWTDPLSGLLVLNPARSTHFQHARSTHAFYATYGRTWGDLGLLAGLRPEATRGRSRLVGGAAIPNDYARVYPTLHLTYRADDRQEWQLNYSHRVRRPEIDDLNPFPEYTDPFTLRAGNPRLLPEDIHSVEAGYSYRRGDATLTSTLYDRRTYHGFTTVTSDLGGGVLLTTHENLATSNAAGLELTANTDYGQRVSLNFSANFFHQTIDASNLGFSAAKADFSWLAKFGLTLRLPQRTQAQFNANYTSARLTPQGERRPTQVANLGLRHELADNRTAIVLTVSDLFNSLKETTVLDTPLLREEITRRRSARIVYLGFVYAFGQTAKKPKDDALKFDNSL